MKIRVAQTVDVCGQMFAALLAAGRDTGHGYGHPTDREIVRRYLVDGVSAQMTRAREDFGNQGGA